jgi:phenylalanine-4-hydroxylase
MNTATGSNDPRDHLVEQGFDRYEAVDHDTWRTLARRQREILRGRIADQFLDGLDRLGIGETGIPDFRVLNERLRAATGWEVVAVPGLIPDLAFFRLLADRKFPAGFWIRKPEQLDYIEEPDIFHDVFGHVPLIMQPIYADYLAAYGRAGLVAADHGALHRLARLYWYTVEFGLARTPDGLRIVGAGIASSPSETVFALESPSPNRLPFDLGRVMRTRYRIDDFQETYFVLDGVEAWPGLDLDRLIPLWRDLEAQPDLDPGVLGPEDRPLSRGDGSYHRAKSKSAA